MKRTMNNGAKKQQRKRKINRLALNGSESSVVVKSVSGFPDQMRVNLVYEDLYTLTTVSNPYTVYQWRGNGPYDPDFTGTGHQPRYFDQYAAIYNKYKVFASKIEIEMINGSGVAAAIFSVVPLTETVSAINWTQMAELPRAKCSEILPVAARYPFKVTHQATTSEIIGLQQGQIKDEDYASTVTGVPSQVWYWNLLVSSIDALTIIGVSFRLRITYDTLFYDRPYIAPS